MNFLAHVVLSDGTPDGMIGALLADFVRGRDLSRFPPGVAAGITLHRRVDSFTDAHEAWKRAAALLAPSWRRYAGIIVDIAWDHVLTRDWEQLHDVPLREFLDATYATMAPRLPALPEEISSPLRRFLETDRLASYGTPEGVEAALGRVQRRVRRGTVNLPDATNDVAANYGELAATFHAFYPEVRQLVAAWCRETPGPTSP